MDNKRNSSLYKLNKCDALQFINLKQNILLQSYWYYRPHNTHCTDSRITPSCIVLSKTIYWKYILKLSYQSYDTKSSRVISHVKMQFVLLSMWSALFMLRSVSLCDQMFQFAFCVSDCGSNCVKAQFVLLNTCAINYVNNMQCVSLSMCDQFFERAVRVTLPITHEHNYS